MAKRSEIERERERFWIRPQIDDIIIKVQEISYRLKKKKQAKQRGDIILKSPRLPRDLKKEAGQRGNPRDNLF